MSVEFPSDEVEPGTAVAVVTENGLKGTIQALNSGVSNLFSTIRGNDFDSRLDTLDALNNALPIADHIGQAFELANVIVQPIMLKNESTGTVEPQPRIVFITADGTAFWGISAILLRDLETLFATLGMPHTWKRPVTVQVLREGQGTRKYFVLRTVRGSAKAAK